MSVTVLLIFIFLFLILTAATYLNVRSSVGSVTCVSDTGSMVVAIVVAHAKVGFFGFLPNQGWEYCATIAIGAAAVGIMGPGDWSPDNSFDLVAAGWNGAVSAPAAGTGGSVLPLLSSSRPTASCGPAQARTGPFAVPSRRSLPGFRWWVLAFGPPRRHA